MEGRGRTRRNRFVPAADKGPGQSTQKIFSGRRRRVSGYQGIQNVTAWNRQKNDFFCLLKIYLLHRILPTLYSNVANLDIRLGELYDPVMGIKGRRPRETRNDVHGSRSLNHTTDATPRPKSSEQHSHKSTKAATERELSVRQHRGDFSCPAVSAFLGVRVLPLHLVSQREGRPPPLFNQQGRAHGSG